MTTNKSISEDYFSVVIRTKNEDRWIGHAIQSIIDHIPNNEIIIVDNNSEDKTLSIASYFQRDPHYNDLDSNYTNLKILNIHEYTPGRALNLGVDNATFENILIMSSHCVLKQIDLQSTLQLIRNHSPALAHRIISCYKPHCSNSLFDISAKPDCSKVSLNGFKRRQSILEEHSAQQNINSRVVVLIQLFR